MTMPLRWNRHCEACGNWCREDNIICVRCYKKLPPDVRKLLWDEPERLLGNFSIVVDWLKEHQDA